MVKNQSHTLAYSLIGLQEMNLAYRFPLMFWNSACLIADSGGAEEEESTEEMLETDWTNVYAANIEDFGEEEEDDEDDEDDEEVAVESKKKKKSKVANYGKIAAAIGKIKSSGVEVAAPNINLSTYTFSPDIENNTIRYGLSGITRIGESLIKEIISKRPYSSLSDFTAKVKITKPQMVNLIKSGAFDCFGHREEIMDKYLRSVSDQKSRVTLQNMKMLIDFNLIPEEYAFEVKVYNFNKYLKKFKDGLNFQLDSIAYPFYERNFSLDNLFADERAESGFAIKQTAWDKIYKKHMDKIRPWVQKNAPMLLEQINNKLVENISLKYAQGSISQWEMDSISCYIHDHELADLDYYEAGLSNYFSLPDEPEIERIIPTKDGKRIPLLKIHRIAGTVLDRDKAKKTVTLLTREGVVTVKIFGDVFTHYDRQISVRQADGKKKVLEKSWFSRGNKIIVTGIRRDEQFFAKKYKNTPYHLVTLIEHANSDGTINIQEERLELTE